MQHGRFINADMALLNESVDSKKLDVRMVERNLARGVLTHDEVEIAVAQLPDDGENADWVSLESLTGEADDANSGSYSASQHQH